MHVLEELQQGDTANMVERRMCHYSKNRHANDLSTSHVHRFVDQLLGIVIQVGVFHQFSFIHGSCMIQ